MTWETYGHDVACNVGRVGVETCIVGLCLLEESLQTVGDCVGIVTERPGEGAESLEQGGEEEDEYAGHFQDSDAVALLGVGAATLLAHREVRPLQLLPSLLVCELEGYMRTDVAP